MKSTTAVVVIICTAIVGLVNPVLASDAQETYLQGLQAYNAGKTDEALKAWSDVLSAKPDSDTTQSKAITALIDLVQDLTKKVDELQSQLDKTSLNPQTTSSTGEPKPTILTLRELRIVNSNDEVVISLAPDPATGKLGFLCMHDPDNKRASLVINGGDKTTPPGVFVDRPPYGSALLSVIDSGGTVYLQGNNDRSNVLTVNWPR